jgi:preprotein translocase subunit SecD
VAIGATPMKQGLDLRGGIHFLLQVDIDSVMHRHLESTLKNMGQSLREAEIRYSRLMIEKNAMVIRFRTPGAVDSAYHQLQHNYPNLHFSLRKNSHGNILRVTLSSAEKTEVRKNTLDQTMTILRNRVNELGVGEAVVQQQGSSRVSVDLPGMQDAARAKQILGGTATLEFRLVDSQHDPLDAEKVGAPIGSKLYYIDSQPILLKRQVVLNGESITSAVASYDQQSGSPSVDIQLGGGGESLFTRITRANIGQRMGIVIIEPKTESKLIHGKVVVTTHKEERVISAPVIQSALPSNFQITGLQDPNEARNLALLLRAGSLPTTIYPVEEKIVGPTLGKENIQHGLTSLEVGMGIILLIMIIYYRVFGIIADIALFFNLILLVAALSIIDAILTLPGIAGIVLTIGMAVDANVLIYERIREELRLGVVPQAAIFAGYSRAFATILDANITTFIVAIILFVIGTGPIKGFAITLSIGLLTSMLTGIYLTRGIVNLLYGRRTVKKLSIGI